MRANTITIIFSAYHVGIRDHRVGNGPHRILPLGVVQELQQLGVQVDVAEIEPVDNFEGEIGRSFEFMRHLDVLDSSYGKVNDYPSAGGMFGSDLITNLALLPKKATPRSLTVCSFDPDAGDGDKIASIAVRAISAFTRSLLEMGLLGSNA
ncbi:uncharacterized protein N7511_011270 [Penicillium nucicola]|uniref:uncharacterized protein n=1 Tax=Penicillium nucicola TaxID=1850975 RepID=UPI002545406D|nr:uncharacterized protein N7511_011270 [Penicillium nucicola]KAJ5742538.1 hypothetical protein N7511_011270 [Penicillium nucicola]